MSSSITRTRLRSTSLTRFAAPPDCGCAPFICVVIVIVDEIDAEGSPMQLIPSAGGRQDGSEGSMEQCTKCAIWPRSTAARLLHRSFAPTPPPSHAQDEILGSPMP